MANDMNIDTLNIKIKVSADTNRAKKNIDSLNDSLAKFNAMVSQTVDSAEKLSKAMENLSNALSKLGSVGKINLNGQIKQLEKIIPLAQAMQGVDFSVIEKAGTHFAKAVEPLTTLGKVSINGTLNQLGRLPEVVQKLDGVDFDKFAKQMDKLAQALENLAKKCIPINGVFSRLPSLANAVTRAFDKTEKQMRKTHKTSSTLQNRMWNLGKTMLSARYVIGSVAGAFASLFEESSAYVETLNLFNVAMGEGYEKAKAYAESIQDLMGIDASEWMQFQGVFANLLNGMGVSQKNMEIMSQNLTQLAYDYSSLMNVLPQEAFEKLNSAMSGQIKGLKEYGNNVSVAMLKQTGLKYGLTGAVASWDQNTQAIMRYITIMDNASKTNVFNDMARTIITPANSMRILNASMTQLKRALGDIVSVLATKVIPYVTAFTQAITILAKSLANFFGFSLPEIDYSGISAGVEEAEEGTEAIGDNLGSASKKAKELKNQLMGFDELNILKSPDDSSSGGGASGGGGLQSVGDVDIPTYDFTKGLQDSATAMLDEMTAKLKHLFKPVTDSWASYGQPVMDSFKFMWDSMIGLAVSFGKTLNNVWQNGTGLTTMNLLFGILTNINNAIGGIISNFTKAWNAGGLGQSIIQSLWDGFNALLGIVSVITDHFREWASNINFTPLLEFFSMLASVIEPVVNIVGSLLVPAFDALLNVMKFIVENPLVVTMGALTLGAMKLLKALEPLKPVFDFIWKLVIGNQEAFNTLVGAFENVIKTFPRLQAGFILVGLTILDLWDESESFREAFTNIINKIGEVLFTVYTNVISPVFEFIKTLIASVWEDAIQPLWEEWKIAFDNIAQLVSRFVEVLAPIVEIIVSMFGVRIVTAISLMLIKFTTVFQAVVSLVAGVCVSLGNVVSNIIDVFDGLVKFISGVMAGDWKTAWEGLFNVAKGLFGAFVNFCTAPINAIIGALNGLISGVVSGMNAVIRSLNKFSFKVPDWVPEWGGKKFGLSLNTFSAGKIPYVSIPKFANGGYAGDLFIANEKGPELVANLGGKPAVVNQPQMEHALENAIYRAFSNASVNNQGGSSRIVIQTVLDKKVVGESVVEYHNGVVKQTGKSPLMV